MRTQNKRSEARQPKRMLDLPLYDSMSQMAAATGIPLAVLTHAKKNGCLFVRHGRCELSLFLEWFFVQGDTDDNIDWAKRDKRAKALMNEVNLEEKRGTVIDFANVERFVSQLVRVNFFGELDRLANEFPPGLKGKSEVQIFEEVERQMAVIRSNLENELTNWKETKGSV